jgi:tetratricopeptide (TPR) repeat protein
MKVLRPERRLRIAKLQFSIGNSQFAILTLAAAFSLAVTLASSSTARAADYVQIAGLFRTGQYAECAEAAAKGIAADEFNENIRLIKIRAEMEQGKYADALATLDAALLRLPTTIQLRWLGREVCRFNNQLERVNKLEDEIGRLVRQAPARYSDSVNRIIVGRFLLGQAIDPKRVLDAIYNEVKKQQPNLALVWLASGDLALDKQDYALAAQNYEKAAKLDPSEPDAHYGLARAFASSETEKATVALQAVLERNPNHVGALLVIVEGQIDSERYDEADKTLKRIAGINPHHPRAAACRAVLSHLRNQPESEQLERAAALKFWPANPEPYYLIGKKLSQKYRFREGSDYQRESLTLAPDYLPAKMQLAQDLLRLGEEEEGWRLADEVYRDDEYSVLAHNLTTLQECIDKFRTIETDGFLLRMEAREADIYGQQVIDLLSRAKATLCRKYDVQLERPIIVEMFPNQQDFAIRTFGMPGGAGFLGVCFGTVITANSPASQSAHPTCWAATLWHEFCHVVTLNKTHNRMPRWLSEGISVYEEREADLSWGQTIKPVYRKMLLGDDLTPVSRLSGAFLNPPSPQHLQFAYLESSLVVAYLVETHGLETVRKILVDLGTGVTINDALSRHTVPIEQLDAAFADYARAQANAMAPEVDWTDPELPRRADEKLLTAFLKEHPQNYAALQRLAQKRIADKNWTAAKEPLEIMRRLYPRDAGADSLYPLLALVHRELNETNDERQVLITLANLSDDIVDVFARLTELTAAAGDWELTKEYARRWLAVSPLQAEPHRRCAQAAENLHDDRLAIECYQALLKLSPLTAAELHLQLAGALERIGDLAAARKHALLALEETPRFRAAHMRLLEITRKLDAASRDGDSTSAPNKTDKRANKKPTGF